jgi:hypothetical protein
MTDGREDKGGWSGDQWAAEKGPDASEPRSRTWASEEYVGDQGEGRPAASRVDADPTPDGTISGNRHGSGESHWAGPGPDATSEPTEPVHEGVDRGDDR